VTTDYSHQNRIRSMLTPPPPLTEHRPLFLTGNEYLSLPEIGPEGEIYSANILHMGARGLLEFSGSAAGPLLQPFIKVNGQLLLPAGWLSGSYTLDWLPCFEGAAGGVSVKGVLAAPDGQRGGCCRLTITNVCTQPLQLDAGWQGRWASFNHIIFSRREIAVQRTISQDTWTDSLVLEARSGLPLAALAMALEPSGHWQIEHDGPGSYQGTVAMTLEPGCSAQLNLYLAVNLEYDGARTTAMDLRRHGAATLIQKTKTWLQQRRLTLEDRDLEPVLNRNLFFNYFYALGRALDTDDLVPVTSRSPRYYVSAAFWSRDTLLWSLPGILLADREIVRELLLTVFSRHLAQPGEHAHYINGVVLYPGFELDQLAAYLLALEHYEKFTGDTTLPDTLPVLAGLAALVAKAAQQYEPEAGLYRSFLDPSDDPVFYPFLVYSNALLQRGFTYLASLQKAGRWRHHEDFSCLALALQQSICRQGTVQGPRGPMFAWAVDGKGGFQLYDNPPGSLQLLAYYGFCSPKDPAYVNTVAWIRSTDNPYFHQGSAFEEAGSLHCGNPWPLAACNNLLAFNENGADFFRRAEMDNGFCCETVNPETGRAATGAASA